jgi:hypothetical protein
MTTPNATLAPPQLPEMPPVAAAAPVKQRRRWPWVLAGVGGAFAVLIGGCAALLGGAAQQATDNANRVADGGISSGIGASDATADVGTPTMTTDEVGLAWAEIPVTNNSSGRSDYWISAVVESADGATQLDTTSTFVSGLEAGQSTTARALLTNARSFPADAVVRITTVQRTAST